MLGRTEVCPVHAVIIDKDSQADGTPMGTWLPLPSPVYRVPCLCEEFCCIGCTHVKPKPGRVREGKYVQLGKEVMFL